MKCTCALLLLSAGVLVALADTPADRKTIQQVMAYSRHDSEALARLFASAGGPPRSAETPEVWSESTPVHIQVESIVFISNDVALVDAVESQIGSVALKRSFPMCLIVKRERGEWRIAAWRMVNRREG